MGVMIRLTEEQLRDHNAKRAVDRLRAEAPPEMKKRERKEVGARLEAWLNAHPNATPGEINRAAKELLRATQGTTREG